MTAIKKFFADESGQGMVEYGLIIALVAIACLVGLGAIGTKLQGQFNGISDKLTTPAS